MIPNYTAMLVPLVYEVIWCYILMQRQHDNKYHPVSYFSKRVMLIRIKFKIVTDCQALKLTLNKKIINTRISPLGFGYAKL